MRALTRLLLIGILFVPATVSAQRPPVTSPLLDRLVGRWVLQGPIAGRPATHDVTGEWVANHQYLRLHEVSRDKTADGSPDYDAFIHIGWDPDKKTYSIIFLDNFWGIEPDAIGAAVAKPNELPFLWKDQEGAVHFSNEFKYDPKTDSWQWVMNNVVNGTYKPFGTVKLTRVAANP